MREPRTGQLFNDRDKYWAEVEKMRDANGLPKWCFNFISVHLGTDNLYSFISPMCLVELGKDRKRPEFEAERHKTKHAAVKRAVDLAKETQTFVVVCD